MKILRKILIKLGLIATFKPSDILLVPTNPKLLYRILDDLTQNQGIIKFSTLYPFEGTKRLYLDSMIAFEYKGDIIISSKYLPHKANITKYETLNEKSYIEIVTKIEKGKVVYSKNTDFINSCKNFNERFWDTAFNIQYQFNKDRSSDIFNLEAYGDLLILFNKVLSFNKMDQNNAIKGIDIEPTEDENNSIEGIKQFNLIVTVDDGIGNRMIIKSYHQDNKLKLKIKECIHNYEIDLMRLNNTINEVKDLLDETSIKNLNLRFEYTVADYYIMIKSNDTPIIVLDSEEAFNSFIDGAVDSFHRILNTGICRVHYKNHEYTCFKGVLSNGIIEYVAISGDIRIQTIAMKYDPIRLRK